MEDYKPIVVFVGASETSGYGLPGGGSYVDKLESLLSRNQREYQIINLSYPGAATSDGWSMLEPTLRKCKPVDAVFITLGLSDIVYGVEPETIYRNLKSIEKKIGLIHPQVDIYIMETEIFQYSAIPHLPVQGSDYQKALKAIYMKLSMDGVSVFPFFMSDFIGNPTYFQSDGVHPNDKGTSYIARALLEYFF